MRTVELRFTILILAGTLLLSACSALKFSDQPDDKAITTEIQAKLFENPELKSRDIRVESQKGVVVLGGAVATEDEKATTEQLTSQVSGVKQVINQLTVSARPSAASQDSEAPEQAPSAAPDASEEAPRLRTHANAEPVRIARRKMYAPPESGSAGNEVTPPQSQPPAPPRQLPPAPEQASMASKPVTDAEPTAPPAPAPPPVPQPQPITIPAGTVVTVRMIDGIDSSRNRAGEEFAASVDAPVVVGDRVVIPRGSDARVRLVQAQSAGKMTGRSDLQLELVALALGSNTIPVESGVDNKVGASRGTRTAETVGGGAVLGALIGAIAGRGKGAAIGAAVGAGAGTAVEASTRGQQVTVPPETKLDFTLKNPVTVTP